MIKYTFKTYIFNGTEHYAYGEEDARGTTMFSQAVPFPDSLLSLAYMDVGTVEPIIRKLNDALWQLALTKDRQYQQSAYALLDELALRHIYFQQFRLDWKYRLSRAMIFEQFTEDVLPRKYLYGLPDMLRRMQVQIIELFSLRTISANLRYKMCRRSKLRKSVPFFILYHILNNLTREISEFFL